MIKYLLMLLMNVVYLPAALCQNYIDTLSNSKAVTIFSRSSTSFSFIPYIVNKAKATPLSGSYHLKTVYMNGFEAGPDYYVNFNKSYALIIGLHGGAAARNFKLFILKTEFNPNLNFDVDEYGAPNREWDFYMSVPFWIEKRWLNKRGSYWNLIGGVNVRYYPIRSYIDEVGAEYPDVNGNYVNVLELDCSIGNNLLPWLNYNIGGGYSMLLRNNNYLQCNLLSNFSFKKMVNGTYQINVTGKPQSTGTYSANLSYIGLSFSYIFTGANKRLRKIYESKMK